MEGSEAEGSAPGAPPSPLSGGYLLIVLGEPYSALHKGQILRKIQNGFLSWDKEACHVDLEKELQLIAAQAPEGEESKNGERLIQFASENLVTEVLIHPTLNTLTQCIRNLLSSFTRHRHIIHAGYTFTGNGSWIIQDGTFSLADLIDAFQEPDVLRVLRAYENTVSVDIHCAPEGDWSTARMRRESFSKICCVRVNPDDSLTPATNVDVFMNYISKYLQEASLEQLLEPSDVVGNIRFSHPTLYVFPGGQGDAALFGINGFNMLVDGGFSRKACFWDFTRHLDRLDAVLITRLNNSNCNGIGAVLRRKRQAHVYPQIGHFFCNIQERRQPQSPEGEKERDSLLINLAEEGQEMVYNLRHLNLKPHFCSRDTVVEPINLYHKVGHGKLDMYVLSPAKDSRDLKEFMSKWQANDQSLFGSTMKKKGEFHFPLNNLVSICSLVVWQPANPNETITRLLFPGSAPQHKIFEGLEKLKHLEFLKHPVCSAKTLSPSSSTLGMTVRSISKSRPVPAVIDKLLPGEGLNKPVSKTLSSVESVNKQNVAKSATIPVAAPITSETKAKTTPAQKPIIQKHSKSEKPIDDSIIPKTEIDTDKDKNKIDKDKIDKDKIDKDKNKIEKDKEVDKEKESETEPKETEGKIIPSKVEKPPKALIETKSKVDHKGKPPKAKPEGKQTSKNTERKPSKTPSIEKKGDSVKSSPTTPKKSIDSKIQKTTTTRTASKTRASPSATPAKSAKEENNRKVVESKRTTTMAARSLPSKPIKKETQKTEKKVPKRPPTASPSKAPVKSESPKKPVSKVSKLKAKKEAKKEKPEIEKGVATDSSTVSTPSTADAEVTATKLKEIEKEKEIRPENELIENDKKPELSEQENIDDAEKLSDRMEDEGIEKDVELTDKGDMSDDGIKVTVKDEYAAEKSLEADDAEEKFTKETAEDLKEDDSLRIRLQDKDESERDEEDEILIIEKVEIEPYVDDSTQDQESIESHEVEEIEDELQKHLRDETESEKKMKKEFDKSDQESEKKEEVEVVDKVLEDELLKEPITAVEETMIPSDVIKADTTEKKLDLENLDLQEQPASDLMSPENKEQIEGEVQEIITSATEYIAKAKLDGKDASEISVEGLISDDQKSSGDTRDLQDIQFSDEKNALQKYDQLKEDICEDANKAKDVADLKYTAEESQPDEKLSTTIESGATTAPTLPEDERIPLDEIKEGIEEKHVKEETKEKDVVGAITKLEQPTSLPQIAVGSNKTFEGRMQVTRDIVKTPDEVADLPVHEEVDAELYESEEISGREFHRSKDDLLGVTVGKKVTDMKEIKSEKDIVTDEDKEDAQERKVAQENEITEKLQTNKEYSKPEELLLKKDDLLGHKLSEKVSEQDEKSDVEKNIETELKKEEKYDAQKAKFYHDSGLVEEPVHTTIKAPEVAEFVMLTPDSTPESPIPKEEKILDKEITQAGKDEKDVDTKLNETEDDLDNKYVRSEEKEIDQILDKQEVHSKAEKHIEEIQKISKTAIPTEEIDSSMKDIDGGILQSKSLDSSKTKKIDLEQGQKILETDASLEIGKSDIKSELLKEEKPDSMKPEHDTKLTEDADSKTMEEKVPSPPPLITDKGERDFDEVADVKHKKERDSILTDLKIDQEKPTPIESLSKEEKDSKQEKCETEEDHDITKKSPKTGSPVFLEKKFESSTIPGKLPQKDEKIDKSVSPESLIKDSTIQSKHKEEIIGDKEKDELKDLSKTALDQTEKEKDKKMLDLEVDKKIASIFPLEAKEPIKDKQELTSEVSEKEGKYEEGKTILISELTDLDSKAETQKAESPMLLEKETKDMVIEKDSSTTSKDSKSLSQKSIAAILPSSKEREDTIIDRSIVSPEPSLTEKDSKTETKDSKSTSSTSVSPTPSAKETKDSIEKPSISPEPLAEETEMKDLKGDSPKSISPTVFAKETKETIEKTSISPKSPTEETVIKDLKGGSPTSVSPTPSAKDIKDATGKLSISPELPADKTDGKLETKDSKGTSPTSVSPTPSSKDTNDVPEKPSISPELHAEEAEIKDLKGGSPTSESPTPSAKETKDVTEKPSISPEPHADKTDNKSEIKDSKGASPTSVSPTPSTKETKDKTEKPSVSPEPPKEETEIKDLTGGSPTSVSPTPSAKETKDTGEKISISPEPPTDKTDDKSEIKDSKGSSPKSESPTPFAKETKDAGEKLSISPEPPIDKTDDKSEIKDSKGASPTSVSPTPSTKETKDNTEKPSVSPEPPKEETEVKDLKGASPTSVSPTPSTKETKDTTEKPSISPEPPKEETEIKDLKGGSPTSVTPTPSAKETKDNTEKPSISPEPHAEEIEIKDLKDSSPTSVSPTPSTKETKDTTEKPSISPELPKEETEIKDLTGGSPTSVSPTPSAKEIKDATEKPSISPELPKEETEFMDLTGGSPTSVSPTPSAKEIKDATEKPSISPEPHTEEIKIKDLKDSSPTSVSPIPSTKEIKDTTEKPSISPELPKEETEFKDLTGGSPTSVSPTPSAKEIKDATEKSSISPEPPKEETEIKDLKGVSPTSVTPTPSAKEIKDATEKPSISPEPPKEETEIKDLKGGSPTSVTPTPSAKEIKDATEKPSISPESPKEETEIKDLKSASPTSASPTPSSKETKDVTEKPSISPEPHAEETEIKDLKVGSPKSESPIPSAKETKDAAGKLSISPEPTADKIDDKSDIKDSKDTSATSTSPIPSSKETTDVTEKPSISPEPHAEETEIKDLRGGSPKSESPTPSAKETKDAAGKLSISPEPTTDKIDDKSDIKDSKDASPTSVSPTPSTGDTKDTTEKPSVSPELPKDKTDALSEVKDLKGTSPTSVSPTPSTIDTKEITEISLLTSELPPQITDAKSEIKESKAASPTSVSPAPSAKDTEETTVKQSVSPEPSPVTHTKIISPTSVSPESTDKKIKDDITEKLLTSSEPLEENKVTKTDIKDSKIILQSVSPASSDKEPKDITTVKTSVTSEQLIEEKEIKTELRDSKTISPASVSPTPSDKEMKDITTEKPIISPESISHEKGNKTDIKDSEITSPTSVSPKPSDKEIKDIPKKSSISPESSTEDKDSKSEIEDAKRISPPISPVPSVKETEDSLGKKQPISSVPLPDEKDTKTEIKDFKSTSPKSVSPTPSDKETKDKPSMSSEPLTEIKDSSKEIKDYIAVSKGPVEVEDSTIKRKSGSPEPLLEETDSKREIKDSERVSPTSVSSVPSEKEIKDSCIEKPPISPETSLEEKDSKTEIKDSKSTDDSELSSVSPVPSEKETKDASEKSSTSPQPLEEQRDTAHQIIDSKSILPIPSKEPDSSATDITAASPELLLKEKDSKTEIKESKSVSPASVSPDPSEIEIKDVTIEKPSVSPESITEDKDSKTEVKASKSILPTVSLLPSESKKLQDEIEKPKNGKIDDEIEKSETVKDMTKTLITKTVLPVSSEMGFKADDKSITDLKSESILSSPTAQLEDESLTERKHSAETHSEDKSKASLPELLPATLSGKETEKEIETVLKDEQKQISSKTESSVPSEKDLKPGSYDVSDPATNDESKLITDSRSPMSSVRDLKTDLQDITEPISEDHKISSLSVSPVLLEKDSKSAVEDDTKISLKDKSKQLSPKSLSPVPSEKELKVDAKKLTEESKSLLISTPPLLVEKEKMTVVQDLTEIDERDEVKASLPKSISPVQSEKGSEAKSITEPIFKDETKIASTKSSATLLGKDKELDMADVSETCDKDKTSKDLPKSESPVQYKDSTIIETDGPILKDESKADSSKSVSTILQESVLVNKDKESVPKGESESVICEPTSPEFPKKDSVTATADISEQSFMKEFKTSLSESVSCETSEKDLKKSVKEDSDSSGSELKEQTKIISSKSVLSEKESELITQNVAEVLKDEFKSIQSEPTQRVTEFDVRDTVPELLKEYKSTFPVPDKISTTTIQDDFEQASKEEPKTKPSAPLEKELGTDIKDASAIVSKDEPVTFSSKTSSPPTEKESQVVTEGDIMKGSETISSMSPTLIEKEKSPVTGHEELTTSQKHFQTPSEQLKIQHKEPKLLLNEKEQDSEITGLKSITPKPVSTSEKELKLDDKKIMEEKSVSSKTESPVSSKKIDITDEKKIVSDSGLKEQERKLDSISSSPTPPEMQSKIQTDEKKLDTPKSQSPTPSEKKTAVLVDSQTAIQLSEQVDVIHDTKSTQSISTPQMLSETKLRVEVVKKTTASEVSNVETDLSAQSDTSQTKVVLSDSVAPFSKELKHKPFADEKVGKEKDKAESEAISGVEVKSEKEMSISSDDFSGEIKPEIIKSKTTSIPESAKSSDSKTSKSESPDTDHSEEKKTVKCEPSSKPVSSVLQKTDEKTEQISSTVAKSLSSSAHLKSVSEFSEDSETLSSCFLASVKTQETLQAKPLTSDDKQVGEIKKGVTPHLSRDRETDKTEIYKSVAEYSMSTEPVTKDVALTETEKTLVLEHITSAVKESSDLISLKKVDTVEKDEIKIECDKKEYESVSVDSQIVPEKDSKPKMMPVQSSSTLPKTADIQGKEKQISLGPSPVPSEVDEDLQTIQSTEMILTDKMQYKSLNGTDEKMELSKSSSPWPNESEFGSEKVKPLSEIKEPTDLSKTTKEWIAKEKDSIHEFKSEPISEKEVQSDIKTLRFDSKEKQALSSTLSDKETKELHSDTKIDASKTALSSDELLKKETGISHSGYDTGLATDKEDLEETVSISETVVTKATIDERIISTKELDSKIIKCDSSVPSDKKVVLTDLTKSEAKSETDTSKSASPLPSDKAIDSLDSKTKTVASESSSPSPTDKDSSKIEVKQVDPKVEIDSSKIMSKDEKVEDIIHTDEKSKSYVDVLEIEDTTSKISSITDKKPEERSEKCAELVIAEKALKTCSDSLVKSGEAKVDASSLMKEEKTTVHRMVVTASSEDGGSETELCTSSNIKITPSQEGHGEISKKTSKITTAETSLVITNGNADTYITDENECKSLDKKKTAVLNGFSAEVDSSSVTTTTTTTTIKTHKDGSVTKITTVIHSDGVPSTTTVEKSEKSENVTEYQDKPTKCDDKSVTKDSDISLVKEVVETASHAVKSLTGDVSGSDVPVLGVITELKKDALDIARSSTPGSDVSERELDIGGPSTPHSEISSGQVSRAATNIWGENSEGRPDSRHYDSDDDVPCSPLSVTSHVAISPPQFDFELQQSEHEDSYFDGNKQKGTEQIPTTMTSSFYGSLPDDSTLEHQQQILRSDESAMYSSMYIPREFQSESDDHDKFSEGKIGQFEAMFSSSSKEDIDFETARKEHCKTRGEDLTKKDSIFTNGKKEIADLNGKPAAINGGSGSSIEKITDEKIKGKCSSVDSSQPLSALKAKAESTSGSSQKLSGTSSSIQEPSEKSVDPIKSWGKPLGLPPPPLEKNCWFPTWDPIEEWGKPLGLPTPAPPLVKKDSTEDVEVDLTPTSNKTTPKKVAKKNIENNKTASYTPGGKEVNTKSKRPESPVKRTSNKENRKSPAYIYLDLSYVPHNGNSHYTNVEFFKRVRARYYVFSGTEPSRDVFNALLEAKQTWEDKDLEVTIIPTYDTDILGYWVAENEELLAKYKIDLSPSASRCTINLQDHETSCSAYRLEF